MMGPILTVELINHIFLGDIYNEIFLSPVPLAELRTWVTYSWAYTLIYFPVENCGSSLNFWELAIGERGLREVKGEKENMPLVDRVAIVAEAYGAVS